MRDIPAWRRYRRFLGPDIAADVDDEIRFHVERRIADLVALGMGPDEARREALSRFGDMARVREECRRIEASRVRRMSRLHFLGDLRHDVRFAARTLLRQPLFSVAAVLTLALGIGVNTAIFSAVNAYLFKPLPVRDPDQLVVIASMSGDEGLAGNVQYLNFEDVQRQTNVFSAVAGWENTTVSVRQEAAGTGERSFLTLTSGSYFPVLGLNAQAGRLYGEREAKERAQVVVLSDQYWERHFNRSPSAVGRVVHVNGLPFTVIGVVPRGFTGTQQIVASELYTPITVYPVLEPGTQAMFERRDRGSVRVIARLQPGSSVEQARSALIPLASELSTRYPEANKDLRFVVELERRSRPDIAISRMMPWIATVFLGLVGLALLVACANVTNLLLARAAARATEIAVRRTLGATGERLVRQLLTESLMLSIGALGVGLLLARWSVTWLNSIRLAVDAPIHFGVELDWRVFSYATAIALTAGVLSGLVPAVRGTRVALSETLKEGGRGGSAGRGRSRMRNGLVIAQVAVSLVLLICAGLFARSVGAAARLDVGFRTDSLLMTSVDVGILRYSTPRGVQFQKELLEGVRAIPGVEHAALARSVPLAGNTYGIDVFIDERPPGVKDGHAEVAWNIVTPDYFTTMRYRLVHGREFLEQDRDSSPPVAVVNEALANRLWPGGPVLGRHLRLRKDGPIAEVVGVVGNGQWTFLNEKPIPMVYVPLTQHYSSFATLHVASSLPAASLVASVRKIISDFDPELVPYDVRTMQEHLRDGLALFFVLIAATLAMAIGILGLVQTVVGLYGVIAYSVSQRTHEFGIRMALGARAGDVTRVVVRQGALLVGVGLVIGVGIAMGVTRLMTSLLIGVNPNDLVSFGAACGVLALLALLSCYLPARRAAHMEPVKALRTEG
jgi:predicted permease